MANALRMTGIRPEAVDYVNAHATSTPIGDTSEARALNAVFRDAAMRPAISSTKALTAMACRLPGDGNAFVHRAPRRLYSGSAHITRLDPACEGLNVIRRRYSSSLASC